MKTIKLRDRVKVGLSLGDFYHMSFDGSLAGVWEPKLPDGEEEYTGGEFEEPDNPRISVSPTIEKCFRAIYPNISHLFEVNEYPSLDFHVYSPEAKSVLVCDNLRSYVHDAHITDEMAILTQVNMVHVGKVRVANTSDLGDLTYRPFNSNKHKERFHSPELIEFKWLTN